MKDVIAKPIMLSNLSEPIIGRTFCAGTALSATKNDSIKSPAGGGRTALGDMNPLLPQAVLANVVGFFPLASVALQ